MIAKVSQAFLKHFSFESMIDKLQLDDDFTWKTVVLNHGSVCKRCVAVFVAICLTSSTGAWACDRADICCVIVADVDLQFGYKKAQEKMILPRSGDELLSIQDI